MKARLGMQGRARWWMAGAAVAALLAAAGLIRIELDMDLFSLLPADSPQARGLRLYQEEFGSSRELVLAVEAADAESASAAAQSLAEAIRAAGVAEQVLWQSPLEDRSQLAALLAFLWFNQPPDQFRAMTERFTDAGLEQTLSQALERMASSFAPQEVARLSRDPYGLTGVLDELSALPSGAGEADDPLASEDGTFRIVLMAPPGDISGFTEVLGWTERVRAATRAWQRQRDGPPVEVRLTGNPVLMAEAGTTLLRDVSWAAAGTLAVVAALFWFAHRSFRPLLRLVGLLVTVLALTLGLGGLLLGRVNVISLGFAAILLGLAADYGLILHQELKSHPERTRAEHRRAVAPSVLWAALTTAGAFFMLTRSSLPGVSQLGVLVGVGMLTAAGVMLMGFLTGAPTASGRESSEAIDEPVPRNAAWWGPRGAWAATGALAAVTLAVLLTLGAPAVDYGAEQLGFRHAPARDVLLEVEQEVGQRSESLWVLVRGRNVAETSDRLARTDAVLRQATADGVLQHYVLPAVLWPDPDHQQANRERLRWLGGRGAAAGSAALEAGFTADSLELTEAVFDAWQRMGGTGAVTWPRGAGAEWLLGQLSARRTGEPLVLGRAAPAEAITDPALAELAQQLQAAAGAELLGWSLLSDSLLGTVQRDVQRVLVPVGVVLLVMLAVAFRRPREVFLSVATLTLSAAALMAFMRLAGWSWNLMNVMALALLLGTTVDYSIHVQYALRRYGGDARRTRDAVGRAILLCGASTAAGFGTLGTASNAGLASLGRVCALGIVIACLVSVYLLPAWWQSLGSRQSETR